MNICSGARLCRAPQEIPSPSLHLPSPSRNRCLHSSPPFIRFPSGKQGCGAGRLVPAAALRAGGGPVPGGRGRPQHVQLHPGGDRGVRGVRPAAPGAPGDLQDDRAQDLPERQHQKGADVPAVWRRAEGEAATLPAVPCSFWLYCEVPTVWRRVQGEAATLPGALACAA